MFKRSETELAARVLEKKKIKNTQRVFDVQEVPVHEDEHDQKWCFFFVFLAWEDFGIENVRQFIPYLR